MGSSAGQRSAVSWVELPEWCPTVCVCPSSGFWYVCAGLPGGDAGATSNVKEHEVCDGSGTPAGRRTVCHRRRGCVDHARLEDDGVPPGSQWRASGRSGRSLLPGPGECCSRLPEDLVHRHRLTPRVWDGGRQGGTLSQNARRGAALVPATRACIVLSCEGVGRHSIWYQTQRHNSALPTYSGLKAKDTHGLSHQEAPQAHGEEEAPQIASQDPSPASQQEVTQDSCEARHFRGGPSCRSR